MHLIIKRDKKIALMAIKKYCFALKHTNRNIRDNKIVWRQ